VRFALVERLVAVVLQDLSEAFQPVSPVRFRFERLETKPRFAAISRASNACVLSRFRVDMEDRGGKIELLLPYATLEPVRETLLQQFMGEKLGRDSIWETHLAEELRLTDLTLDVVLDEQTMPLSSVLSLRRGDRITLDATPETPVKLRCNDVALFEGDLGRRKDRLAVRITRELREAVEI
jgi:flagellar motor switch protein FliM